MDTLQELKEWFERHILHRDVYDKKVKSITFDADGHAVITRTDGEQHACIQTALNIAAIQQHLQDGSRYIVTLNTRHNFEEFMEHFEALAAIPHVCVFFVHPTAAGERRWSIYPHTHARIADKETLQLGLQALFNTIEEYT